MVATVSLARPNKGEIARRTSAGLKPFTMSLSGDIGWKGFASITLWGKDVRNNAKILRAWDEFSSLAMVTLKDLKGVEFMEATWSRSARPKP
jgi:hypothetical protein